MYLEDSNRKVSGIEEEGVTLSTVEFAKHNLPIRRRNILPFLSATMIILQANQAFREHFERSIPPSLRNSRLDHKRKVLQARTRGSYDLLRASVNPLNPPRAKTFRSSVSLVTWRSQGCSCDSQVCVAATTDGAVSGPMKFSTNFSRNPTRRPTWITFCVFRSRNL